ncbi:MAG TPA: hypothetical protein VHP58_04110 [Alphaproteobacteria bacterium]|nr:hypothetical protein [Alphaproteobacteria bacterium]
MKNGLIWLAVVLSVTAFALMLRLKTDVQSLARERDHLADEQFQMKETKRVLEAEYAHLSNPLRLLKLAKSRNYIEMNTSMLIDPAAPVSATLATSATLISRTPAIISR